MQNHHTNQMPGSDSSKAVDSSHATPTSPINFNMVSMLASHSFPRHSPLPINHPSLSTSLNSTALYNSNLKSDVMSAPSRNPKLNPSLDPSRPPHSALYPSPENQVNFESSKTCHTHTYPGMASHPSTAPLTWTSFQVPGAHSPSFASLSGGYHLDHNLQYVMSRKHTTQYHLLPHNGLEQLSACMKTTPLQLTPKTALALHPAAGVMEQSAMQEHSSPDLTELAPFQSGSMTTYSSAYSESTWSDTTRCKNIGQMTSQKTGVNSMTEANYGSEEPPCPTVVQRNSMRISQHQFATSQTGHHNPLKTLATPTPLLTLMISQMSWASPGNMIRTSHSEQRLLSLASSGTSKAKQSLSRNLRRLNISTQFLHGNPKRHTTLRRSRNYMASSSMLALWSQLGEHTSPASKNSWPSLVIILSCHTPPLAALTTIYTGGSKPSPTPTSPTPSQGPKPSLTSLHTQMLAQKLVLASPSEATGEPGAFYQDGKKMDETLAGKKPLASSFSSSPSFQAALQAQLSRSSVTTKVSSKAGGKEEAATLPQMRSSSWYTTKVSKQALNSTPDISQARTTLLTTHPMESTSPETSSYHPSPSHMHTNSWLSTLMKNLAQVSCARSVTEQLQSQVQNPTEKNNSMQEQSSTTPSNVRPRSSLHKRKAGSDTICHPAALPLPPQRNTWPAPYLDNLRPLPSMLCPHVLAQDCI